MTEQPPNSKAAWEEVGKQFESLGKSIADAFGTAWQDPNNRAELEKIKASIKQMADDVEKTVGQAASSDTGQRIKSEAEKAAQSLGRERQGDLRRGETAGRQRTEESRRGTEQAGQQDRGQ